MRPSKDEYYIGIAEAVSKRSTCIRRRYGAVIVRADELVASGYNGPPRGSINCDEEGYCPRMERGATHNSDYTSDCPAQHAEANAIVSAGRRNCIGSTLYLYGYDIVEGHEIVAEPCIMCKRLIQNVGIAKIINSEGILYDAPRD